MKTESKFDSMSTCWKRKTKREKGGSKLEGSKREKRETEKRDPVFSSFIFHSVLIGPKIVCLYSLVIAIEEEDVHVCVVEVIVGASRESVVPAFLSRFIGD